jgi:hypothetical protein
LKLRQTVVQLRRITQVIMILILTPAPWFICYIVLGSAPYFFALLMVVWLLGQANMMVLTWWVIKFVGREKRRLFAAQQSSPGPISSTNRVVDGFMHRTIQVSSLEQLSMADRGGGLIIDITNAATLLTPTTDHTVKLLHVGDGVPLIPIKNKDNNGSFYYNNNSSHHHTTTTLKQEEKMKLLMVEEG